MITTYLIIFFHFLSIDKVLEPGIYESDNDLFIELRLSKNLDSVTFFFPHATEKSSKLNRASLNISPNFRNGLIEVRGNKIYFVNMECDFLPSSRPELYPLKFDNNIIRMNCENMSQYLFGRTDFSGCDGKYVEFRKK
jgi:hypothetical protein